MIKEDPEGFEKEIQKLRQDIIDEAPLSQKLKLQANQSHWDGIMRRVGPENRFAMAQALFYEDLCERFNPALQDLARVLKPFSPEKGEPDETA